MNAELIEKMRDLLQECLQHLPTELAAKIIREIFEPL